MYKLLEYFEFILDFACVLLVMCFRALAFNTRNAAVHSAIGFTLHLSRDLDGAIESYHKALSIQPGDTVTSTLLDQALGDLFAGGASTINI
jgi:hypothetical protein